MNTSKILRVSIPQAVSTVATLRIRFVKRFRRNVSIPQTVSTVATWLNSFYEEYPTVSIPQAVSTVATRKLPSMLLSLR